MHVTPHVTAHVTPHVTPQSHPGAAPLHPPGGAATLRAMAATAPITSFAACATLAAALAGAPVHAGGVAPFAGVPPCLRPFDLEGLMRSTGRPLREVWPDAETALLEHLDRVESTVDPALAELERTTGRQRWLNWPAIKPERERRLQERALDATRAADAALFTRLAELLPAQADAMARLAAERTRRTVRFPTWLPHRLPVDLAGVVADALADSGQGSLDAEARTRLDALLDRWATLEAATRVDVSQAGRSLHDYFERGLAAIGIDVERDASERATWMPRAWEVWVASSRPIARTLADAVARQDQVADEAAAIVDGGAQADRGLLLHAIYLDRRCDIQRYQAPPPPRQAFAAALADPSLSEAERAELRDQRRRWLVTEVALLRRARTASQASDLPYWPLAGGGWLDPAQDGPVEAMLTEIDTQRVANDRVAFDALDRLLGERRQPIEDRARERLDEVRRRERPPERWDPSPFAQTTAGSDASLRLAFDTGPLTAADADRLVTALGLDAETAAWWRSAVAAAIEEVRTRVAAATADPRNPEVRLSAWGMTSAGAYRFDAAAAETLRSAALEERAFLDRREGDLFDALAKRVGTAGERLALERDLRAIERERGWIAMAVERGDERRDLVRVGPLVALALTASPTTLERVRPRVAALAAAWHARREALEAALVRTHLLAERAMWAGQAERAPLAKELADARREVARLDEPHRAAIRDAIRSLIDDLIVALPDLALALDEGWRAEAFPALFGSRPPAAAAFERARRASPDEPSLRRIAEEWRRRDDACCRELMELAIASAAAPEIAPARPPAPGDQRAQLADRRSYLSEMALVALRVAVE